MQITFRASPELLKVGEIGESIVKADDSFRRQFSILVLAAVRNREIPVRNKNGFKIPPESLDITERQTRDFAERHFLERLGDFDADLQRARESAAAQPWIQQHYNIDAKLQACANDFEKYKQHLEPQIQSETNRLLDDWYRDASVLVFEVAEWFCKAHDFEGQMTVSNSVGTGEIARRLAKWFDKPLDDLPPPLRKIAELYLPGWSELSDADRRARADEVDHQVQATLGDRFEKARMDVEQANAATPARFVQLAMQDGFDKVTREKAGERNFEAKVAAVNLSDERCIELAHSHELRIADWTALTGIGIGVHWSYVVSAEGVAFRKWTEGEISEASVDRQIEMHQDNEAAPLKFPCTPAMIILFIDAAQPGSHSFSVPDAFRQAVTDTPVPGEAPEQNDDAPSGAPEKDPMPAKKVRLLKIVEALEQYAKETKQPFECQAMPGPLGNNFDDEGSFHWLCAQIDRTFMRAPTTFEKHRAGICAVAKWAQPTDFYRSALPHIAPIFDDNKKAQKA